MSKQQKQDGEPVASVATGTQGAVAGVSANTLYTVVFLSGAALMGLEMAGARIVEPHFGSTIYVWGSIIGVFMLALSLGYWGGGRLSDRFPRIDSLGIILIIAALLVLIIPPIAPHLSAWMNDNLTSLDVRYRTLFACLILFAPPSICMGMVSPFAVRLAARQVSGLGSVAGSLYAVSTFGSIVGTLLVSFVLVEYIGTSAIVYFVGVVLAAVAVFCFFQGGGAFKIVGLCLAVLGIIASYVLGKFVSDSAIVYMVGPVLLLVVVLCIFLGGAVFNVAALGLAAIGIVGGYFGAMTPLTFIHETEKLLETKESAYHYITILNGRSQIAPYQLPARLMMFNNLIESGIILDKNNDLPPPPAQTACGYVDLLHLGMVLTGDAPKNMLIIGCGGGVGPRMFKENYPGKVKSIDVVDIDPWVFKLAEKYFAYPFSGDQVIKSHTTDGRLYVEQENPDKKWDYIIMDAYSSGGRIPKHLITEEFFTTIRDHLAPGGVMVINVISSYQKPASGTDYSRLFRSVYKTLERVYDADKPGGGTVYAFPRNRSGQAENIILLATKPDVAKLDRTAFEHRYRALRNQYFHHTQLDEVVARQLTTRPETDDVPLLTDDFCPTDSMVHK